MIAPARRTRAPARRRRKRRAPVLATLRHAAVAVAALTASALVTLVAWFAWLPSVRHLRDETPARSAYMERQEGRLGHRVTHRPVPLGRISPHVIAAVVVSEDATFFDHRGVDFYEVWQSMRANVRAGRIVRGGGTITLQLARNLFYGPERSFARKLNELGTGLKLELSLTKPRILELYLNFAQFGPAAFGVEAAARAYFGTSAASLSPDQAAALAAVLPSPEKHRPDRPDRWVERRTRRIREWMSMRTDLARRAAQLGAPP
jgi:monofunctional biosynthetic peptidoglycan transglycosylase